jgi:erythromycin esterase-like protein
MKQWIKPVLLLTALNCIPAVTVAAPRPAAELRPLVSGLCDKQIVLLGEERTHSSAATIEAKSAVLRELVETCGFSAVIFESAIYDFLNYQRALDRSEANAEQLAGAIGGLWSSTAAFTPLLSFLHEQALVGKLRVGGIDVQLGSATARYAQRELPDDLAGVLSTAKGERCREIIGRHNRWEYTSAAPFDTQQREQLAACIDDIQRQLQLQRDGSDDPKQGQLQIMASSYAGYLQMLEQVSGARTQGMFDNLLWYRDQLPVGTRMVIWTATVHATSRPIAAADPLPLGARLRKQFGDDVASVGISALGGSFGRSGAVTQLAAAPADSVEALAFGDADGAVAVLDHAALKQAGKRASRVLDYARWHSAEWSTLLDAIVVVREELPTQPAAQVDSK